MVDVSDGTKWSSTDSSNNAASPNGYSATTTPANVVSCEQALRGALRRMWEFMGPVVTAGGTANAITYTSTNATYPVALAQGQVFAFIAAHTNSGATTLQINSLAATAINKNSSSGLVALAGNEIQAGATALVMYSGSVFELINPIPAAVAGYLPLAGGSMTGAINFASAGNLSSASTTNIGAAVGNYINITGTTTITAFDTVQAGSLRILKFAGALTLTYNASSLILPGAANITTAAGDVAIFMSLGSGNWICINYQTQASTTVPQLQNAILTSGTTWTSPSGITASTVFKITGIGGGGGSANGNNGGGGAGGMFVLWISGLAASTGYTYAIGAAGANTGGNGGNTTISLLSTTYTANGGAGTSSALGGLGGTATNGTLNIQGQGGSAYGTYYGPIGGGSTIFGAGGNGQTSTLQPASGYGAGAAGGLIGAQSGAQGIIIIEWIA